MGSKAGREMQMQTQGGGMMAPPRLNGAPGFSDEAMQAALSAGFGSPFGMSPSPSPGLGNFMPHFNLQPLTSQMPMMPQPMHLNMPPLQLPTPPPPPAITNDWAAHFMSAQQQQPQQVMMQPMMQAATPPPPPIQPQQMYYVQSSPTPMHHQHTQPPPPPSAALTPPPPSAAMLSGEQQTMSTQHAPLQPHYTHNLSTMSYTPSVWPPPHHLMNGQQQPPSSSMHSMKPKMKVINFPPVPIRY